MSKITQQIDKLLPTSTFMQSNVSTQNLFKHNILNLNQQNNHRQGAIPYQPLKSEAAWTAADMYARQNDWKHPLSPSDVTELLAAADTALSLDKPLHLVTKSDVTLPTLGPKLEAWRDEVVHGRGFILVSGVPVDEWSKEQVVAAYWVIGLYWGKAKSNNKQGHLVGHIKNIGHDPNKPDTRLYATSLAQVCGEYHYHLFCKQ
jgi:hypothetical protein